jgi:hypothetical protein
MTLAALLLLLLLKVSLSAGDSEKNATSDPEIKAEHIRSNTTISASSIWNISGLFTMMLLSVIKY